MLNGLCEKNKVVTSHFLREVGTFCSITLMEKNAFNEGKHVLSAACFSIIAIAVTMKLEVPITSTLEV